MRKVIAIPKIKKESLAINNNDFNLNKNFEYDIKRKY